MTIPSRLCLSLAAVCTIPVSSIESGDWPGWRGEFRDDVSIESGLLKEWPPGGPQKLWTFKEAGSGYSSFAVVGESLFTVGADKFSDRLMSVNVTTGMKQWSVPLGERWENRWGDGPRSTPTVSGDRVVALGGRGNLACVSTTDGQVLWTVAMTNIGGQIPNWGYSESALIDEGRVIVTPGNDRGTMAAFDLKSGELLWQSAEIVQPAHYSSVIVAVHNGQRQYIQLGPEALFAVRASDGSLLWETKWPGKIAVIPTPIFHGGRVYVSAGYGVGSMLAEIGVDNEVSVLYHNKVMKNRNGGVIRIGDHVYGYSEGPGWVCQELETGEMVWNQKRILGRGTVSCADGMLYCLEEESGICALVRATPKGWEEYGRVTIDPQTEHRSSDGRIWSHPVIANGRLYLRDQEIICCYEISDSRQASAEAVVSER